jgi:hypothetical protein
MTAVLLTLALFAAWWLIGVAVLVAVRADTASLRIALTAPVLGMAATVLSFFVLSHAGVAMEACALPVTIVFLVGSAAVIAVRRPTFPASVAPVLAVCIGALVLAGWPMLVYGFGWIANANDDMANYVLSATQVLHHGLLAPPDLVALSHDRDYPSVVETLHAFGSRPGADIMLGAFASVARRPAYQLFMPLILALNLCTICGTAALAMQASRRRWVAVIAAALVAVSPLATFGVLQQLLAQVGGLALATTLFALLMRRELHRGSRPALRDVVPIGILVAAVIVVYVELAAALALGYALYVSLLAFRRELDLRVVARLWLPAVALTAVVLNTYGITELRYVGSQTHLGVSGSPHGLFGETPSFGFSLVPSALPGIVGLQKLPVPGNAPLVGWSIVAAAILLTGVLASSVLAALRGVAASVVVMAFAALGIFLGTKSSDYGLYKLYMYVQPFLAAGVAVWLAKISRKRTLAIVFVPLALLVASEVSTQQAYVRDSRDPLGLRHASARDLLPAFHHLVAKDQKPIISVTENPTLGKLEAVSAGQRPMNFISQNFFTVFIPPRIAHLNGWRQRSFKFVGSRTSRVDRFMENTHASAALSTGRCTIVLPTGTQTVVNRRALPEGSPDLVAKPCDGLPRNTLVFISSKLGWSYFAFHDRREVAFYQVEPDSFYSGHTMSGFGRYTLFRILRPSTRVRLEINLSTTFIHDGSNVLPPAGIVGKHRISLPLVGRGSARVFSPPFQAQTIDGQSYALLDMGQDGKLLLDHRPGLEGLWGRSIPVDPRYVASFVRDISLVTDAQYRRLHPPAVLSLFPKALANPDVEYSGIYEDGWAAEASYAVLAGGSEAELLLRAEVPPARGGQRLQLLVNGLQIAARKVAPGHLELRLPVPSSRSPRRVELRWASAPKLPAPDGRPASALVRFLGIVPSGSEAVTRPPSALEHFPSDLKPGLSYSGIYSDGWIERQASVVLAGGPAADLRLKAEVPPAPGGQRLQLSVNGHRVANRRTPPGALDLRFPLPASRTARRIQLRWAAAPKLPAPDGRPAAALIKFLGIVSSGSTGVHPPLAVQHFPSDLKSGLSSGVYSDGWLERRASIVLAGGAAAELLLRAEVPPAPGGQRLQLLVNGRQVEDRMVTPGELELRLPVPAAAAPRRVELRWASAPKLPAPDGRPAAALVEFIGIVRHKSDRQGASLGELGRIRSLGANSATPARTMPDSPRQAKFRFDQGVG